MIRLKYPASNFSCMGVNISDIVPRREVELSDLAGKTVAVDALPERPWPWTPT